MCLTVSELYGSEVHSGVLYAISCVGAAITKLLCASLLVNYMDQKYIAEFFMPSAVLVQPQLNSYVPHC